MRWWAALAAHAVAEQLRAEEDAPEVNPSWAALTGRRCARTNNTAEFLPVYQYDHPMGAEGECGFPGGEAFTARGAGEGPEAGTGSFKYLRAASTPQGYAVVYETLTDLGHATGDSPSLRAMCDRDAACTGYTVQCTGCEGCAHGAASCLGLTANGTACCTGESYGMLLFGAQPTRTESLRGAEGATRAGMCFRKGAEEPRPDLGAYLRLHHQNCSGFFHAHPQREDYAGLNRCGPNRNEPCQYAVLPSKCGASGGEPCSCQEACERNLAADGRCRSEDRCEVATQDAAGWCHFWTRAGCQPVQGNALDKMWVRPA